MTYASDAYKDDVAEAGMGIVDKIILVDVQEVISHDPDPDLPLSEQVGEAEEGVGVELDGTGIWRPSEDIDFEVDGGETVAGWRALDEDNNIICGNDLPEEEFNGDGTYTLEAETTGMVHELE